MREHRLRPRPSQDEPSARIDPTPASPTVASDTRQTADPATAVAALNEREGQPLESDV